MKNVELVIGNLKLKANYKTNEHTIFDEQNLPIDNYKIEISFWDASFCYLKEEYNNDIDYVNEIRKLSNLAKAAEQYNDS